MIFRSTLRSLSKEPGFVATSIVTLALGIGASTAIFSVIESVLLRPLPSGEAQRLVVVWETEPDRPELNVAGANLIDWQDQNASFDGLAAFTPVLLTRGDGDAPERLAGVEVTPNFFDVMDVLPHLGRGFTDDLTDAETVILSYEYWERASGALRDTLTLNDRNYTVIGVTPPGFKIPFENTDLWTRSPKRVPTHPIDVGVPPDELRGLHWLRAIARLKPGVTIESGPAFGNGDGYAGGEWHDDRGWTDGWDADIIRSTAFPLQADSVSTPVHVSLGLSHSDIIPPGAHQLQETPLGYCFGSAHSVGMNGCMGDGSVRFMRDSTDLLTLFLLCIRDDGGV